MPFYFKLGEVNLSIQSDLAEVQDVSRHCSFQPAGVHDEARESDEPWWWRLETGDVIKLATGLVLSQ